MSEIICPQCGASNPSDAIECKKCHHLFFDSPSSNAFQFEGEEDDWLKSLRDDTEPPPQSEGDETKPSDTPPFTEEVPDWLARIRQRSQEERGSEGQPEENAEEEELPDWLRDVEISPSQSEPSSTEPEAEEELPLPDWLSLGNLEETGESAPVQPASDSLAAGGDLDLSDEQLPDWLKGIEQTEESAVEPPSTPQEETLDWLESSNLFAEEADTGQIPLTTSEEAEPDWLKSFESFGTSLSPLQGEEEQTTETGEDWLKAFESFEGETEPLPIEEETPPTLPAEVQLEHIEELPTDQPSPDEAGIPQEELLPEETIAGEIPISDIQSPESAEDWLASFPTLEEGLPSLEGELPEEPPVELSAETEDLSSILEEISPLGEGASSAFVLETPPTEPPAEEEYQISPFISEELPEWFDEQVFEPSSETPLPAAEGEAGLEPAELPGWLEAMRPIDAVAPGRIGTDEDQRIETSGPLSGFQGVLPAEALITQYSKPVVYSTRLQVSEKQRNYANLLESILQEEKQGRTTRVEKAAAPQILARMLIGIVLAATVLFVLIGGVNLAAPPSLFAPENVAFFTQLQSLISSTEQSSPILLVVDFEPALAGEITTIAQPVMNDLIKSGKSIAIVSINPAGAVLADELLLSSASEGQILNLGYLPGGVTSIAALASQPSLAAPRDRFGVYAWDQTPFQNVQRISDFAAILLLSDNTDTSRLWIEQFSPLLEETPLLVIASNQAAPMIQPYVQNGQAAGMLAGLPGLAAYQQLSGGTASLSPGYMDAYQAGLVLIIVLILLFSLYYLVMQFFKKPEPKGK